jgi:hypothetical protein
MGILGAAGDFKRMADLRDLYDPGGTHESWKSP